uniref:SFRICE_021100 n=1 Tax=Spodoptera frugiperda TaxID=7108 RepID=A0A2H1W3S0_SPOFR
MSLGRAGLQCSGVFMVVSTVDPGLQELQRVYVTELLLNDWTDFDENFYVCSRGSEIGLNSQFYPLDNLLILECFTLDPTNFQIKDV